jgi:hypothetical protein
LCPGHAQVMPRYAQMCSHLLSEAYRHRYRIKISVSINVINAEKHVKIHHVVYIINASAGLEEVAADK